MEDYEKHYHDKAKKPLKPYVGKEIVIDDDLSIIPHQLSEKGQGKTYFHPAKEKPFIVKVEAPECPSPDENYEDACEEAHKSGRPLPEKKKRTSTATATAPSHEDPAEKFEKNCKRKSGTLGIYVCHVCGKDFPRESDLANHQTTHEQILFACDLCPKNLRQSSVSITISIFTK